MDLDLDLDLNLDVDPDLDLDLDWHMELDMDFDCGGIVDGRLSIAQAGQTLFQLMLATASGDRTKSELNGLGDNEFVPWQLGGVM